MHSNQLERYKRSLQLSDLQREILVGSMLGDGCLALMPNGKTARFMIEQSYSHKEYVDWLYEIFRPWVNKKPRQVTRTAWGRNYDKYLFQTFSHTELLKIRRMFYQGRKKIIPRNISDFLTQRAFAIWFMDDGSSKSKECNGRLICTHGFTDKEVNFLVSVLKQKFGLLCRPRMQRDGTEIYINAQSAKQLYRLLNPYICDSMRYKLPRVAVD
jgi:hypothetical protein